MITPPNVSENDFKTALALFEKAVGKEWVFTIEEDLDLYKDAYSPLWSEEDEKVASAAIAPKTTEEVQAVVKIANEYSIPLYPISTGKNLGYGGSAPVLSGSVVLDLKRMNKIIEVSEENAFALVEPGVSYFDLYNHIQEKGYRLWLDVPDPGWGSPMGNALDHGAGYTTAPYRDHFDAHCGMEVVTGGGELVRTGMGALPGAETWQQFKYGVGPIVDGLFSQSNFGVVTKMGFWLYPEPEAYRVGTVEVPRHDDIHEFIRILSRLMYSGTANSTLRMTSPLVEQGIYKNPELKKALRQKGGPSPKKWDQFASEMGLNSWGSVLNFHGPKAVIAAQWEHVKEQFSTIPGATFLEGVALDFPLKPGEAEKVRDKVSVGIPNLSIFELGARSKDNPEPSHGHVWFTPVIPMTGEAILKARRVFTDAFIEWDVSPLGVGPSGEGLPYCFHSRTFVFLYGFPITRDVETNRKNRETFRRMIDLAAEHGWGEYRAHPAFMDQAVGVYNYNDNALTRMHEKLKDALDPKGIISAGRYGIWPKNMRKG